MKVCKVEGCSRPVHTRGLCGAHYQRQRKGQPLEVPIGEMYEGRARQVARGCRIEGCERPHKARGLCSRHYQRWREGLDLEPPIRGYCRD